MVRKRLCVLWLLLSLCGMSQAQTWEVGFNAGGAGYMGDLNQRNPVKISGMSTGLYVKRNIDAYFGVAFHYNYGSIKANDATSSNAQFRDRNLKFKTGLNEASLQLEFNFFEFMTGVGRRRFSPYLFAGAGMVSFNPKTKLNGDEYELAQYNTEGSPYKTFSVTIPFGAGVRFHLKESLSLFSLIGYRNPFTDYLDDVSGTYPDPAVYASSPGTASASLALSDRSGEATGVSLGRPGTQRGDFRKRDTYMFVGIGISYTFVSSKCY